MSEAIEITSIGRSHGRLTGPIFLRAVDQLYSLEFRSARSKDWPVNRQARVGRFCGRGLASLSLLAQETKTALAPDLNKPPLRFACVFFSNGIKPANWWAKGSG